MQCSIEGNVTLKTVKTRDGTTQIEHVIVSRYGIFCCRPAL